MTQGGPGDAYRFDEGSARSYAAESSSNSIALADLNQDGILDIVTAGSTAGVGMATVRLGSATGTFGVATSYATETSASNSVSLADLNADGVVDLLTVGSDGAAGRATVRFGSGNGTFGAATSYLMDSSTSRDIAIADINQDGIVDLVSAGTSGGTGSATLRFGVGNGTFGASSSFTMDGSSSNAIALADLNSDGRIDIVTGGSGNSTGRATVRLATGNGSFGAATSYVTEDNTTRDVELADLNGDGFLDLLTVGGIFAGSTKSNIALGRGNGTFGAVTSFGSSENDGFAMTTGDFNSDGALDIARTSLNGNGFAIFKSITTSGVSPLLPFSLKSLAFARQVLPQLEQAQNRISAQRGVIGAFQSRLSYAISNLQASSENFSAAGSRIRDVDIAADSASLARFQILQQAASMVLAQANQQPSLAIQLLKN